MATGDGASWDSIHPDLLSLVFSYLPLRDLIRSAAVCKSWRHLAAKSHDQRPKLPWLWLHRLFTREESPNAYSLSDQCYCNLKIPQCFIGRESADADCWSVDGSYEDWLVLFRTCSDGDNFWFNYALYNPFSKAQIRFPHLDTHSLVRFRVSSSPQSPGCVAVVILKSSLEYESGTFAYFCNVREGSNASWGNPIPCYDKVRDAIFYGGSLFTINSKGTLYVADTDSAEFKILMNSPSESSSISSHHNLMVSGDELLMLRLGHEQVMVYKANFELATWEIAQSLKGQALFLPYWSMPPSSSYCIEGDCVYFEQYLDEIESFRVSDGRWIKECFDKKYANSNASALFFRGSQYTMLIPKPNFCLKD